MKTHNEVEPLDTANKIVYIVVLIYNIEKYLENCLNSVINQTYQNYQAILVDDGSTDNCSKICDEYTKKDNRFHVIHKQNEGTNLGRKIGVESALKSSSGSDLLTFLDGDDTISPDYLAKLVNSIEKTNADVAIAKYQYLFEDDRTKQTGFLPKSDVLVDDNKRICLATFKADPEFGMKREVWCGLYPIKYFENINWQLSSVKIADDTMLLTQLLAQSNKVIFLADEIYNFLQRANSHTNTSKAKVYKAVLESNELIVKYLKEQKGYDFTKTNEVEAIRNHLNLIGAEADLPKGHRKVDISNSLKKIKDIKLNDDLYKQSPNKQKVAILIVKLGGINLYSLSRKLTAKLGITQNLDISGL